MAVQRALIDMITTCNPPVLRKEGLASKVLTLEDIKLHNDQLTPQQAINTQSTALVPPSNEEVSTLASLPRSTVALPVLDVSICQESCSSPPPASLSPPKHPPTSHGKNFAHKRNTMSAWSRAAAIEIKRNLMHTSLGIPHSSPLILLEFLARTHLEQFPDRYMGSLNDVHELVRHMILMHQVEVHGDYRVSVRPLPPACTTTSPRSSPHCMEITICCVDKPKVAALLTRVLDGAVRDVIDADIMTSKRNLVFCYIKKLVSLILFIGFRPLHRRCLSSLQS